MEVGKSFEGGEGQELYIFVQCLFGDLEESD